MHLKKKIIIMEESLLISICKTFKIQSCSRKKIINNHHIHNQRTKKKEDKHKLE